MPISRYFKGSGRKVMASMREQYGADKAKRVFYATAKTQHMEPRDDKGRKVRPTKNGNV